MSIRLVTRLLILVTALGHSPFAAAQGPAHDRDWAAVMAQPPGTRLTVKMKTGETVKGKISSVSQSALILEKDNSPVELDRARIKKVYRVGGGSVAKSTLIGLGIGAGAGAAIGAAVAGSDRPTESGEEHLPVVILTTGGATIGTATRLVTGLFRRKKVLIYESK